MPVRLLGASICQRRRVCCMRVRTVWVRWVFCHCRLGKGKVSNNNNISSNNEQQLNRVPHGWRSFVAGVGRLSIKQSGCCNIKCKAGMTATQNAAPVASCQLPVAFCGINNGNGNGRHRRRFRSEQLTSLVFASSRFFPLFPSSAPPPWPPSSSSRAGFADMEHYLTTQFVQLPRMQTESEKCAQSSPVACCCCCLTDAPATEIGAKMSPACTPWICIDHRSKMSKLRRVYRPTKAALMSV